VKVLLPLAVAVASASMVPKSLAGPSDSAIGNANSNAKFLRCGTEHPSAAKAAKEEKRFRELLRQVKNGKKPDRPGGGNGKAVAAAVVVRSHHPQRFRAQDPL
jgi:hypothetical protein